MNELKIRCINPQEHAKIIFAQLYAWLSESTINLYTVPEIDVYTEGVLPPALTLYCRQDDPLFSPESLRLIASACQHTIANYRALKLNGYTTAAGEFNPTGDLGVFVHFNDQMVRYYLLEYSEVALFRMAETFNHNSLQTALKEPGQSAFGAHIVLWKEERWQLIDFANKSSMIPLTATHGTSQSPDSGRHQTEIEAALQQYQQMRNDLTLLRRNGAKALAVQKAKEAFSCLEKVNENFPYIMDAANNLATLYGEAGDWLAAEPLFERSLAIRSIHYGRFNENTATAFMMLGMTRHSLNKNAEALDLLESCLSIRQHLFGQAHPQVALALLNLATIYGALGRMQDKTNIEKRVDQMKKIPEVLQFLQAFKS